ncbi:MAG TPA: cytochrome c3 family protein, partial [Anaerolineae bacterium]|nr:cytochrome c3 family protein [Anaerolineae bacterium]
VGLAFALPMMLLAAALVRAEPLPSPAQQITADNCLACHSQIHDSWSDGAHGQAGTDEKFLAEWKANNNDPTCMSCHGTGYDEATQTWRSEGVTCIACHPLNPNHPKEPIQVDRTGKLCGTCHTETYFEWQASTHRNNDLACSSCHDPHQTSLKAADAGTLCATCHQKTSENFAHTAHSQQGLTCADCHLTQLTTDPIEGHSRRDHTFSVRLDACNRCHSYQMHDPQKAMDVKPTPQPVDAMVAVATAPVTTEPQPVSPFGFAIVAGLIGLAFGMVLAPWLEKMYKKGK